MGAWASIGKWLLRNVAPVVAEQAIERINRPKPAPVPRVPEVVVPEPVVEPVPVPVVVAPPTPVAPPAPTREWEGWGPDNVFAPLNLDVLAVETGVPKDTLMGTRNDYLALMEAEYRRQMTDAGRKTNGSSAAVFRTGHFREFLRTGTIS